MKIIRVFPRRTSMTPRDDYAFVGDPPLLRPQADEVHVSCTFTWDMKEAERLWQSWKRYYPAVRVGGVAYSGLLSRKVGAGEFVPGRYVRDGVTITSRGCNNLIDNNLLQCSKPHLDKVFDMLRSQHAIKLSGGLQASLLTDSIADSLRGLRIKELFFACDTRSALKPLERARKMLEGFTIEQLRAYVMLAYAGETMIEAGERLRAVWNLGFMPFAQLYQPPGQHIAYSKEWRRLAKLWSRPGYTKAIMGYGNKVAYNEKRREYHLTDSQGKITDAERKVVTTELAERVRDIICANAVRQVKTSLSRLDMDSLLVGDSRNELVVNYRIEFCIGDVQQIVSRLRRKGGKA